MTDPTHDPDTPEATEPPGPPDPLDVLAVELLAPDALTRVQALSREDLLGLSSRVVGRAREQPDADAAASLAVLHRGALLSNQREILGLLLGCMAEVAEAMGDRPAAIDAFDKLARLMELRKEPRRAHAAWLALASAQELGHQADAAEATLLHAVTVARGMATGVGRAEQLEATALLAKTLRQLGTLYVNQGRVAEGQAWLEGAADLEA